MIDLKVTYDDGRLTVHNVGETDTDVIWLALIDIDSNLVKDMMWVAMPPNTYVEPPHSEAHPSANGYRIEAFYDDEEKETQFSAEIIWGEPNYKHYFNNPRREFGYGPYVDLFFNDEYDGEVVIGIDDVVYDLGANVGVFTMWALENGAKQIYSFEPTNYLRPYLYETLVNTILALSFTIKLSQVKTRLDNLIVTSIALVIVYTCHLMIKLIQWTLSALTWNNSSMRTGWSSQR